MYKKNNLTIRQKKGLKTKNNLFECATKLFREKGYYRVTVDEIITKAGVSKGTFYTHFESKDQVVLEQLKIYDNHYNLFYKTLSKYQTVSEKILVFIKDMFSFTVNKIGFNTIYVLCGGQLSNNRRHKKNIYYREEDRPFYKYIQQMIKEGQEAGEFRDDITAKEITKMFLRCIMGIFFEWFSHDGKFDIVEDSTFFFSLFMKSIEK